MSVQPATGQENPPAPTPWPQVPAWFPACLRTLTWGKRLAAVLLMVCFVLPLSECREGRMGPDGQWVEHSVPVEQYAYQALKADEPSSWLVIPTFFWPLLFWRARTLRRRIWRGSCYAAELVLCGATAYVVMALTLFDVLRYGGYLAYGAVLVYAVAVLLEIAMLAWRWWCARATLQRLGAESG